MRAARRGQPGVRRRSAARQCCSATTHQRTSAAPQVKPPPIASSMTRSPVLDAPVARRRRRARAESRRPRCCRAGHGDDDLFRRDAELLGGGVDDALVRLVRHEPVDVLRASCAVAAKASSIDVGDHDDGVAEDLAALHPQDAGGLSSSPGRRRHRACRGSAPSERRCVVSMPRSAACPRPRCASSTTAPAPSPNSTQVARSFQSRMREKVSAPITSARLCEPELRNLSAVATRVDEAGADRLQVEGGAVVDAEPRLDLRRGRREGLVRRRGRADDEVDVAAVRARRRRAPRSRGLGAEHRGRSRPRRRCGAPRCRCAGRSTRRRCRPCSASSWLVTTRSGR